MMLIAMGTTITSYSVHGYDINDIIKYLCLYAVLCELVHIFSWKKCHGQSYQNFPGIK